MGHTTGSQRLLFMKESIQQVTGRMARERTAVPSVTKASCKLAWAMRYIRAVERGNWRRAAEARTAFPEISSKIGERDDKVIQRHGLDLVIHSWILQLARDTVTEAVEEVKKMQATGDEEGVRRGKENIIRKLKRIHGGSTSGIKAMKHANGEIRTVVRGMIDILQSHWSQVFQRKEVGAKLLDQWLEVVYPKGPADVESEWRHGLPTEASGKWEIRRKDLSRAIQQSNNSAPGPDGLPYKVWRELGETGVDVLWDAMAELHEADALDILNEAYRGAHEFNAGIMVCLPKSAVGVNEEGEDIYDAASTRPLSIVNTDNRLMCSAARLRWEKAFSTWVSSNQKGFIRGRSMLSNVLTIDHEAMRISLQCNYGAVILFDFKAAFPSIERQFMMRSLRWLGVPARQLRFPKSRLRVRRDAHSR